MNTNKILMIVLYIVLIGGIAYAAYATKGFGLMKGNEANSGQYQAIFLTNGQVYFGKMSGANNQWVTVKDIYYLQVQQISNGRNIGGNMQLVQAHYMKVLKI